MAQRLLNGSSGGYTYNIKSPSEGVELRSFRDSSYKWWVKETLAYKKWLSPSGELVGHIGLYRARSTAKEGFFIIRDHKTGENDRHEFFLLEKDKNLEDLTVRLYSDDKYAHIVVPLADFFAKELPNVKSSVKEEKSESIYETAAKLIHEAEALRPVSEVNIRSEGFRYNKRGSSRDIVIGLEPSDYKKEIVAWHAAAKYVSSQTATTGLQLSPTMLRKEIQFNVRLKLHSAGNELKTDFNSLTYESDGSKNRAPDFAAFSVIMDRFKMDKKTLEKIFSKELPKNMEAAVSFTTVLSKNPEAKLSLTAELKEKVKWDDNKALSAMELFDGKLFIKKFRLEESDESGLKPESVAEFSHKLFFKKLDRSTDNYFSASSYGGIPISANIEAKSGTYSLWHTTKIFKSETGGRTYRIADDAPTLRIISPERGFDIRSVETVIDLLKGARKESAEVPA